MAFLAVLVWNGTDFNHIYLVCKSENSHGFHGNRYGFLRPGLKMGMNLRDQGCLPLTQTTWMEIFMYINTTLFNLSEQKMDNMQNI